MKTSWCLLLCAAALAGGCGEEVPVQNDSSGPPVNTARPNPIVQSTSQVNVPLTNVPQTTTPQNR